MDDNPRMADDLKDRIRQALERKHLSPEAASKQAGMERSYLSKLLDDSIGSPRVDTIRKIATALEVSADWLVNGVESVPIIDVRAAAPGSHPPLPVRDEMANDIPVMGTAAGNHTRGAFKIGGDAIDYVRRPPGLIGAKGIYALYIEGESMVPQFNPADLVFVSEHRPVRVNDPVIVQTSYTEGEIEGSIGIYLRRDEQWVTIGKHNPKAEVKIRRGNHTLVHKVLTNNELFGL